MLKPWLTEPSKSFIQIWSSITAVLRGRIVTVSSQTAAVHSNNVTQDSASLKHRQEDQQHAGPQPAPSALEGQHWCSHLPGHPADQLHNSALTSESQLITCPSSQGRLLVPRQGTQLWHATFNGNVPTDWWLNCTNDSSSSSSSNDVPGNVAQCSTTSSSSSSSTRTTTWDELCAASSHIQQHFRFAQQGPPGVLQQQSSSQRGTWPALFRRQPRAELNRLAYLIQLHRQPELSINTRSSRFRAAYARRQAVRLHLQQEKLLLDKAAAASSSRQRSLASAHTATTAARGERQSLPLRLQGAQQHQQQQVVQQQAQPWDPPLLTWRQLQLLAHRRCRLRSHGSVAAADLARRRHRGAGAGLFPAFVWPPAAAAVSNMMQALSPSFAVSGAGSSMRTAAALPRARPGLWQAGQGHTAAQPQQPQQQPPPHTGEVRRCVARRDEHGKLLPLPPTCTGAGSSSGSTDRSASHQPTPAQLQHGSCSSGSRCVAGIGCDLVMQATAPPTTHIPDPQHTAVRGGRVRRLWTPRWLRGHGAAAPAAAATVPATADMRDQQPQPLSDDEGVSSSSSSNSLAMLCPRCASQPGALAEFVMRHMQQQQQEEEEDQQQVSSRGTPGCALCGAPEPTEDDTASPSHQHMQGAADPSWMLLGGIMMNPGLDSPVVAGFMLGQEMRLDGLGGFTAVQDSDTDSDSGSDDDFHFDYDVMSEEDESYPDSSDSDDDDDDLDEAPGLTSAQQLAAQASPYTFRNEHNVIYGFWTKCPLG